MRIALRVRRQERGLIERTYLSDIAGMSTFIMTTEMFDKTSLKAGIIEVGDTVIEDYTVKYKMIRLDHDAAKYEPEGWQPSIFLCITDLETLFGKVPDTIWARQVS